MSQARYLIGDTRDVTATLPDASVDFVMTSPPFLALRSYLPADHPDKHRELGSEPNPATFIDMLLGLTAEWGRVLTAHGSIAIELGDTYSGSGGSGGNYKPVDGSVGTWAMRDGQDSFGGSAAAARSPRNRLDRPGHVHRSVDDRPDVPTPAGGDGWPLAKSKAMIPELYRIGLAYGINPLTGRPSPAGRWRVRNVVTWCRTNPPPGALGDKYRPSTSDIVIATRAVDRWFDLDAVRRPSSANTHHDRVAKDSAGRHDLPSQARTGGNWTTLAQQNSDPDALVPPLDHWVISPGGYEGAHYAVYPPELCTIPIDSMCPREVCATCGLPRRRIVKAEYQPHGQRNPDEKRLVNADELTNPSAQGMAHGRATKTTTTVGWTDCGHGTWRRGIVFDPFAGSGTTLMVATGMGDDAIGIDFDARNAWLAYERIGMFVDIVDLRPAGTPDVVPVLLEDADVDG